MPFAERRHDAAGHEDVLRRVLSRASSASALVRSKRSSHCAIRAREVCLRCRCRFGGVVDRSRRPCACRPRAGAAVPAARCARADATGSATHRGERVARVRVDADVLPARGSLQFGDRRRRAGTGSARAKNTSRAPSSARDDFHHVGIVAGPRGVGAQRGGAEREAVARRPCARAPRTARGARRMARRPAR